MLSWMFAHVGVVILLVQLLAGTARCQSSSYFLLQQTQRLQEQLRQNQLQRLSETEARIRREREKQADQWRKEKEEAKRKEHEAVLSPEALDVIEDARRRDVRKEGEARRPSGAEHGSGSAGELLGVEHRRARE